MSASNPGRKTLSEASLTIWRFVQRYPGAMSNEVRASVPGHVDGLYAHRVQDYLYSLRDRGYLRHDGLPGSHKCCWYVAATPVGADDPHGPVPDLVHVIQSDPPAKPRETNSPRTHSPCYAQIQAKVRLASGPAAAPRQTPIGKPWTEPYMPGRRGMRPGALDFRAHPSRRGDERVHCYAKPAG